MNLESLERLSKTVSVQDVMTSTKDLKRADTLEEARNLFHEFDVVPFPRRGRLEGFFKRDSDDVIPLEVDHLLSSDTDVLQIPKLLGNQPFYFVVSINSVIGYIHYSDLNKVITKVPFFVMFQGAERRLWDRIEHRISESDLYKVFEENAAKGFLARRDEASQGNVDLSWIGVFTFPSVLRLARYYGLIDLPDHDIGLLRETRNNVAHSDKLLVTRYDDVVSLAEAYDLIKEIIG